MHNARDLRYFPISLFSETMGFAGLTLAFITSHELLLLTPLIYQTLSWITLSLFALLSLTYLVKIVRFRQAVKNEWQQPQGLVMFPTFSISMMLIAMILDTLYPSAAAPVWYAAISLHLVFTFYTLHFWLNHPSLTLTDLAPTWFIPAVGNIIAPIGAMLYANADIAWFFFSIGIIFWLILLSLLMQRLIFNAPMPDKLTPTLFILIAPPAMGFLAYLSINEFKLDGFAYLLYYTALFMTLFLFSQYKRFIHLKFSVTSWAYAFPLAAMTNASFLMYELTANKLFGYFASVFIALLSALIVHLTLRMLLAIKNKEICIAPVPTQALATPYSPQN